MKSILLIFFSMVIVLNSCSKFENNKKSALTESELNNPLSKSAQLQSILEWQNFKKVSGESMLLAHEKLNRLEKRCNQSEGAEKLALRRIYNNYSQRLDHLQITLFRHGIKFRNNICQFTQADAINNTTFRNNFTTKLNQVHDELDAHLND